MLSLCFLVSSYLESFIWAMLLESVDGMVRVQDQEAIFRNPFHAYGVVSARISLIAANNLHMIGILI